MGNRGVKGAKETWWSDGYERRDRKLPDELGNYTRYVSLPIVFFGPNERSERSNITSMVMFSAETPGNPETKMLKRGNAELLHVRLACEETEHPGYWM